MLKLSIPMNFNIVAQGKTWGLSFECPTNLTGNLKGNISIAQANRQLSTLAKTFVPLGPFHAKSLCELRAPA
ncbi:MAG: hypothetical protein SH868_04330 [Bythopirellula sp.]|nr:hypothetical protein [Bythopirellula sp.]